MNHAVVSASTAMDSANFIGLIHTLAPRSTRSSKPAAMAIGSSMASSRAP